MGQAGRSKGIGKNIYLVDDTNVVLYGQHSLIAYDFQLPFRDGGTFTGWASFSGVSSFEFISGIYTLGSRANLANGKRPTLDRLKALIGAHDGSAQKAK